MVGDGYRSSCTGLFKKFDISPALCQYIFSLTGVLNDTNCVYYTIHNTTEYHIKRRKGYLLKPQLMRNDKFPYRNFNQILYYQ
jgi:hypothetical protein